MNGDGKSDTPIVPEKPANKGEAKSAPAEPVEGRDVAKGNSDWLNRFCTQRQEGLQNALVRVRQKALKDQKLQFTSLWHLVYHPARLREAFNRLRKDAASGIDGMTWQAYDEDLVDNLQDLSDRLRRGAYRARPVKRVYIPKADGRQRPIGIPVVEDKIVQSTTVEVLNAVYEADFKGFSYGFRPRRSQHNALDALSVGLMRRKVNWVLDADIRGFFDSIDHGWLLKFVEHRIADERVLRHIKKWLNAGVLEDAQWKAAEKGTPQGGSISPLLANIYLHYAFDLWAAQWRRKSVHGDVIVVRYADDFVVGFERLRDARRFLEELKARLQQFGLELHPEKTRLIEFGRFASPNRKDRGEGKPETFDFLGFTHYCGTTRNNRFIVKRKTARSRIQRKLAAVKIELRRRIQGGITKVGTWLSAVVSGHYRYFAVPFNSRALEQFRWGVVDLWRQAMQRLSQRSRATWERVKCLADRWIPRPRILHPYPWDRLRV